MTKTRKKATANPVVPRRVVVALRMAGIAGQDKLNDIFDYLSSGRRWQLIIYRTKHEFTAGHLHARLPRRGVLQGVQRRGREGIT